MALNGEGEGIFAHYFFIVRCALAGAVPVLDPDLVEEALSRVLAC